VTNFFFF